MKRILCAAALLLAASLPVSAEDGCQPVHEILSDLKEVGAPEERISALTVPGMVQKYIDTLPINVPSGSYPVGLLFTASRQSVIVGLVEPAGCVRFGFVIPANEHRRTMGQVLTDA